MIHEKPKPDFHKALQSWFSAQGRSLPWRDNPTPYAVMVSEFMLQQTTVAAVLPFFSRWMLALPDVSALASAAEPRVLKLWEGLGYYSRARNLQRAAKAIVNGFDGKIPHDLELLRSLPGIGPYTAAAIAAFAFDKPVPVLDANINRVVARLFDYRENIATAAGRAFLEQAAASLLPPGGGRDHTSALMDLGATICRAGTPDCPRCPLKGFCRATEPATLPVKPAKKAVTPLTEYCAFASTGGRVFLLQSSGPRWKGLWLLPPGEPLAPPLLTLTYAITRYKVRLHVTASAPRPEWTDFPAGALPPMPSPHRKALASLFQKIPVGTPELF